MTSYYATAARYYDAENADKDEDLGLYAELVEEFGDPVLVIGSGSGRVAQRLAALGHRVHGIEIEPTMFDRAEARRSQRPNLASHLTYHLGSATEVELDETFKLVILPYNTLMHFHEPADQETLLERARAWTDEGGLLVIDLPNPGEAYATQDTEAVLLERDFIEPESGHLVQQFSSTRIDRAAQLLYITWMYEEIFEDGLVRRTVAPVTLRYFFQYELRLLLEKAGFGVVALYGDHDRSPFADGAPNLIVLAT